MLSDSEATGRSLSDEITLTDRGLAFLDAIVAAQAWDADIITTLLEKPHKWDDEFRLWLNNGAPTDPQAVAFEDWVTQMDAPQDVP